MEQFADDSRESLGGVSAVELFNGSRLGRVENAGGGVVVVDSFREPRSNTVHLYVHGMIAGVRKIEHGGETFAEVVLGTVAGSGTNSVFGDLISREEEDRGNVSNSESERNSSNVSLSLDEQGGGASDGDLRHVSPSFEERSLSVHVSDERVEPGPVAVDRQEAVVGNGVEHGENRIGRQSPVMEVVADRVLSRLDFTGGVGSVGSSLSVESAGSAASGSM